MRSPESDMSFAQLRALNTRFRARPHRKPYTARHATSAFWKPLGDACGSASINVDNCVFASTSHEFTHPARKRGVSSAACVSFHASGNVAVVAPAAEGVHRTTLE